MRRRACAPLPPVRTTLPLPASPLTLRVAGAPIPELPIVTLPVSVSTPPIVSTEPPDPLESTAIVPALAKPPLIISDVPSRRSIVPAFADRLATAPFCAGAAASATKAFGPSSNRVPLRPIDPIEPLANSTTALPVTMRPPLSTPGAAAAMSSVAELLPALKTTEPVPVSPAALTFAAPLERFELPILTVPVLLRTPTIVSVLPPWPLASTSSSLLLTNPPPTDAVSPFVRPSVPLLIRLPLTWSEAPSAWIESVLVRPPLTVSEPVLLTVMVLELVRLPLTTTAPLDAIEIELLLSSPLPMVSEPPLLTVTPPELVSPPLSATTASVRIIEPALPDKPVSAPF